MATVIVVIVVVVLVVLATAEHMAQSRVLEWIRAGLEEEAGAPTELRVPHRPLLLNFARRLVPSARTTFTDLPIAGGRAQLDELRVDLEQLHLTGPRRRHGLRAESGTFRARLAVGDLNTLVTLPPGIARVELGPDEVRLRTVAGVAIDVSVELRGQGLRVRARGGVMRLLPATGLTIGLPDLPFGARIRELEPVDGAVVMRGDLDPDELVVQR